MQATSSTPEPLPKEWIERIFDRMLHSFGKKFVSQWEATFDAIESAEIGDGFARLKSLWAQELAGLTVQELQRGVAALQRLDWPPTLPEFMRLCRPRLDPLTAYYEAVNGVIAREHQQDFAWSHPAIFWATVAAGQFDLKTQTYAAMKSRWEAALEAELSKGQWAPIPPPMRSLPPPAKRGELGEAGSRAVSQLRALGTSGDAKSHGADHKDWARKIIARAERGEKGINPAVLSIARSALAA